MLSWSRLNYCQGREVSKWMVARQSRLSREFDRLSCEVFLRDNFHDCLIGTAQIMQITIARTPPVRIELAAKTQRRSV
jgi:hypothetical protein